MVQCWEIAISSCTQLYTWSEPKDMKLHQHLKSNKSVPQMTCGNHVSHRNLHGNWNRCQTLLDLHHITGAHPFDEIIIDYKLQPYNFYVTKFTDEFWNFTLVGFVEHYFLKNEGCIYYRFSLFFLDGSTNMLIITPKYSQSVLLIIMAVMLLKL